MDLFDIIFFLLIFFGTGFVFFLLPLWALVSLSEAVKSAYNKNKEVKR